MWLTLPEWSKAFWEWRRWVSSLPIIHKGHLNVIRASPVGSVCACYRFEKVIRDSEMSQLLVDLAEPKISITITHISVMISITSNTKYWTLPEPTRSIELYLNLHKWLDSSLSYSFFSFKEFIFRKCIFHSLFIKYYRQNGSCASLRYLTTCCHMNTVTDLNLTASCKLYVFD